ncbi:MAG: Oligopeptide transporter, family [Planctomycetaceae bacterium]|nr:Oligopeptide transporter, family [Planctomycetaceae bacterium]
MSDSPNSTPDPFDDWYHNVYQPHVRQLSVRSIVTGMMIGGVMSVSNLYVGLMTGWGLGVTITASIIAYAVFQFLEQIYPPWRDDPFTILENYTMSSAASAAGYMSSAGLVSAIPALYLTTGRNLTAIEMMTWIGAISMLGVFMAIPMKRQMIDEEKLPFPSGIATAETLKSMHSEGAGAVQKAKALAWGGLLGAVVALWREGVPIFGAWYGKKFNSEKIGETISGCALPSEFPLCPGAAARSLLDKYTLGFEGSMVMIAAGAIMGIRVGVSLLVGALAFYGVIGPILVGRGIVGPGYAGIVSWTLWPSTAMMVTSGLLSFGMKWRTILKALVDLVMMFQGKSTTTKDDPMHGIEVPMSWFLVGTFISGLACVVLGHMYFNISYGMGVLAVLLTFLLSIVAARATGETDVTPIGAMGKITQLTFGALSPRTYASPDAAVRHATQATIQSATHAKTLTGGAATIQAGHTAVTGGATAPTLASGGITPLDSLTSATITTNLMTACITSGAASHCADLLTDLKTGYLLGGNPRKQTISQLFGVLAGTLVCVPIYFLVVDNAKLGTKELPAPSAKVWQKVAELMSKGPDALPDGSVMAMLIGGGLGIALTLLEELGPKSWKKYLPSTTGLGLAGVIPAFNSISMFLGALGAWILARKRPDLDEQYTIPVSSGLIAGESLAGVGVILISRGPELLMKVLAPIKAKLFGG